MAYQITIPDDFFEAGEIERLKSIFKVKDDADLVAALNRLALAALDEYHNMLLGKDLPTSAVEIRQFRLYYLIKHYFLGRLPSEVEVSSLFQISLARSKSLITNTLARFRNFLDIELIRSLQETLLNAESVKEGKEYRLYIDSAHVVEELDRRIATLDTKLKRLNKVRSEANVYTLAPDSYDGLCKLLNIQPKH
jgi:uncharacterized small protein (DUF1192 family)